jgi:hypothetical protein
VKFSLERQLGPGSQASAAASLRRTIEVIDELTIFRYQHGVRTNSIIG